MNKVLTKILSLNYFTTLYTRLVCSKEATVQAFMQLLFPSKRLYKIISLKYLLKRSYVYEALVKFYIISIRSFPALLFYKKRKYLVHLE